MTNEEHGHVALPKLYGAPAYARPPIEPVARTERPFDPDELPLEAVQTDEERQLVRELTARPYGGAASVEAVSSDGGASSDLRGRSFRLGAITGLLRGGGAATEAQRSGAPAAEPTAAVGTTPPSDLATPGPDSVGE